MQHHDTIIHVDLQAALQAFVAQLATANGQRPGILRMRLQEKLEKLDDRWQVLYGLAQQGMQPQLAALLGIFLQEWADKEAIELALAYPGQPFDPTNQVLLQSFQEKLSRQHQALSSELLLLMEQGRLAREQLEAQVQPADWQGVAFELVKHQQQVAQDWQSAAEQWQQCASHELDAREQNFWQAQQVAEQWSNVALSGMRQTQQGVDQLLAFASAIHHDATCLMESTYEQQQQMLPQAVQEATQAITAQRIRSRLIAVAVIIAIVIGLLALAYFLGATLV